MKNKILVFVLAAAITFSLVACGGSDSSSKNNKKSDKNDVEQSDAVKSDDLSQQDNANPAPESNEDESDLEDDRSKAQEDFDEALGGSSTLFYKDVRMMLLGNGDF